jgi:hypothetical protein
VNINWTTVTAIVGAALGVWNFVQGFWQRRVRLRVIPQLSVFVGTAVLSSSRDRFPPEALKALQSNECPCIEVTNLSVFPVTIAEVGLSLLGTTSRFVIPTTVLPKRLEPRESIDIRAESIGFPKTAKLGYATTQCGHTCHGDSLVLKKHRESQG